MDPKSFEKPDFSKRGRPKKETTEEVIEKAVEEEIPIIPVEEPKTTGVKCKYTGTPTPRYVISPKDKIYIFEPPEFTCILDPEDAKKLHDGPWPVNYDTSK